MTRCLQNKLLEKKNSEDGFDDVQNTNCIIWPFNPLVLFLHPHYIFAKIMGCAAL